MKLKSLFVLGWLLWTAIAALSQPVQVLICETDEVIDCPCGSGLPPPDGSLVFLFQDLNQNGPDGEDSQLAAWPWCDEPPCCFDWTYNIQPPGPPFFYIVIAVQNCCWTSGVFTLGPGPFEIELGDWICHPDGCDFWPFETPEPPVAVRATPCHGALGVHWDHTGENLAGFRVFRNGVIVAETGPGQRSWWVDCVAGAEEICVTAFNLNGDSDPVCVTPPPFLLRFAEGPSGDVAGDRVRGSWFSVDFTYAGVNPGDIPFLVTLVLLSNGQTVDSLCGAFNVGHLTCPLPGWATLANCRIALHVRSQDFPAIGERDTTESLFDLVDPETSVQVCESDEFLTCPCGENLLPLWTMAALIRDVNFNGHDASDSVLGTYLWCTMEWPCCGAFSPEWFDPIWPFYVRIAREGCCWESGVFTVPAGLREIELDNWSCSDVGCPDSVPPNVWTTIRFQTSVAGMGCPCNYPLQFPPGTMLRLKLGLAQDGPSENPVIAEMPISAGSGLPPWDGCWSPRPDSVLADGPYVLEIRTDACCWATWFLTIDGRDTLEVLPQHWNCSATCERRECSPEPVPPTELTAVYSDTMIRLTWQHRGDAILFTIFRNGEEIADLSGDQRMQIDPDVLPGGQVYEYWMTATSLCGESAPGEHVTVVTPGPSTNAVARPVPAVSLAISPNPFNATATIRFVLPEAGEVRLVLYDMLGREAATLLSATFAAGEHRVSLDGTNFATGLYFVRLVAGSHVATTKLLLLK